MRRSGDKAEVSRAFSVAAKRWPDRSQSRAGASAIGVGLPVVDVDAFGQIANGDLDAGAEVVGLTRLALERARHQAARDVLDVDEVAAGDAAVLDRQRLADEALSR